MKRALAALAILIGAVLAPANARAQQPAVERERAELVVPKGFKPPAGMCRIWVDGVPASMQPAPTDCATALRDRPPNGRIVFGDALGRRPSWRDDRGLRTRDE